MGVIPKTRRMVWRAELSGMGGIPKKVGGNGLACSTVTPCGGDPTTVPLPPLPSLTGSGQPKSLSTDWQTNLTAPNLPFDMPIDKLECSGTKTKFANG